MVGSRQRLRDLAVEAYLWGQRCKWPLPRAARLIGRKLLAPQIDRINPDKTDEWPPPVNLDILENVGMHSPVIDPTRCAVSIPSPTPAPWLQDSLRPEGPPRLRCMVATNTLKLGGLEMVALYLARGLPFHGFDAVLAHTPTDRSGA